MNPVLSQLLVIALLTGSIVIFVFIPFIRQSRYRKSKLEPSNQLLSKPFATRDWFRRFPDASKQELRDFFILFPEQLGIEFNKAVRFSPDDTYNAVLMIYDRDGCDDTEYVLAYFEKYQLSTLALHSMCIKAEKGKVYTLGEFFALAHGSWATNH